MPETTVEVLPNSPPSLDSPSLHTFPAAPSSAPVLPLPPPLASVTPPNSASIPSLSHASSSCSSVPSSSLVLPNPNTVPQIEHIENIPSIDHLNNTATHINQPMIDITLPNPAITLQESQQSTILPPSMIDPLLHPVPDPGPPVPANPSLHHSTQLCFPYSCTATLDGLLPNP